MAALLAPLTPGAVHSWEDLGAAFGFKPDYLSAAGGMPVSASTDSVILITHPGGGKSFDYKDYWDGKHLIYTGRGKTGDQQRSGANLDVAENRRDLHVFEAAGSRLLRYLGPAVSIEEFTATAPGDDGLMRKVLQFRLEFGDDAPVPPTPSPGTGATKAVDPSRLPRTFDPNKVPATPVPAGGPPAHPDELAAKHEKAAIGHHVLLVALNEALLAASWDYIDEIPSAYDLRAIAPDGTPVIFEAKTITALNELVQTRSATAQLLEYRVEYGEPQDRLCLVTNEPISVRRGKLLSRLGIAALVRQGSTWTAGNDLAKTITGAIKV